MQPEKTAKHVMNKHGVELARLARNFGVRREDFVSFLKNKKRTDKFFNGLNTDNWFTNLQAEAKKIGARIHLITNLSVDYTKPHNDAAMTGGPQTESNYNVLKVADLYQPSENKVTTETIILFNWPNGGGNYQKAIEWGLSNNLLKTTPHVPFAIGENYPKLNYELGSNPMYVVETTGCTFDGNPYACRVWWRGARRESLLRWQSFFGRGFGWFAFRK